MIKSKKIHFISIGGSIMHSLAIVLKSNGNEVTGSDDIIYNPAKSNLEKNNLLPKYKGYNKKYISENLDIIIVGMHTKKDNVELLKAKKLKLPILSFPEFIRKFSTNKQRIVIAGSHGKSTITSIIMHVLNYLKKDFDFVIGAKVQSFNSNIRLTNAPIIIIEGDEYCTSPLDNKPKFLNYDHHIVLINGISWDHANVFPTKKNYISQFKKLIDNTQKGGVIIYLENDKELQKIMINEIEGIKKIKYSIHNNKIKERKTFLIRDNKLIPLNIFGDHNMQNLSGAKKVLEEIGVTENNFYKSIRKYKTPRIRLEIIKRFNNNFIFRDFAHSPSKVLSTVNAVKNQFNKKLTSILELHTLSSLNDKFLVNYKNTLNKSDESILYVSKSTINKKFSENNFKKFFNNKKLIFCNNINNLKNILKKISLKDSNLLFMSSGNFDNLEIKNFYRNC